MGDNETRQPIELHVAGSLNIGSVRKRRTCNIVLFVESTINIVSGRNCNVRDIQRMNLGDGGH